MNKRELWAMTLSCWRPADYFVAWEGSDPVSESEYLFATREDAVAFAMAVEANDDVYNECDLFHGEVSEEDILYMTGFESIEDFDEALKEPYSKVWNRKNFGEDEKSKVARYIIEEYNGIMEGLDCANYDFNKSIEGSIIVVWSWEKYIGYAREFKKLRYATCGETEQMLFKEDKTFVPQVDVVMTKEEVEACEDLQAELTKRLLGGRDQWKWTKPSHVDSAIMDF